MRLTGNSWLTLILLGSAWVAPLTANGQELTPGFKVVQSSVASAEENPTQLITDRFGFRYVDQIEINPSQRSRISIDFSESLPTRFGSDDLNRTHESATEMRMEAGFGTDHLWTAKFRSQLTRQDVQAFNPIITDTLYKQQTYALTNGWKQWLTKDLSVEIFSGAAKCAYEDEGRSIFMPLGGIDVRRRFSWGSLSAILSQDAEGGGELSGIYGSQLERRLMISGQFDLTKALSFSWNCGLMVADGAFHSEGMLNEAPVVSAGVGFTYQVESHIRASVKYAHRQIWGKGNLTHGFEGPLGLASLQYSFN